MDFEGYTFVFLSKYKQDFSHYNMIYIMILLFNQGNNIFKMEVTFICLN